MHRIRNANRAEAGMSVNEESASCRLCAVALCTSPFTSRINRLYSYFKVNMCSVKYDSVNGEDEDTSVLRRDSASWAFTLNAHIQSNM